MRPGGFRRLDLGLRNRQEARHDPLEVIERY
jgi:hypothetical protein